MQVMLISPQIPQNAGNIARTCAVTGAKLTLVRPLGFSVSSRHLKRAGLDYWNALDVSIAETFSPPKGPVYFFSTHAETPYWDLSFTENDTFVFGSETDGLPKEYWENYPTQFATIPMLPGARSLNLSNAVAIVLYEAWRQHSRR